MKLSLKPLIAVSLISASLLASPTFAATSFVFTSLERVMLHTTNFGGCMIKTVEDPRARLPRCGSGWLSLDCNGDFQDANLSQSLLDVSQMAFALDRGIRVEFTDDQMHNGFCVVKRIDINK